MLPLTDDEIESYNNKKLYYMYKKMFHNVNDSDDSSDSDDSDDSGGNGDASDARKFRGNVI